MTPGSESEDEERGRLRAVLDFPEPVESHNLLDRAPGRRAFDPPSPAEPAPAPVAAEPVAMDDEVARRLDQLTIRLDALAELVGRVLERAETAEPESPVVDAPAALTSDDLAHLASRIERMIDARLETMSALVQPSSEVSSDGQRDIDMSPVLDAIAELPALVAEEHPLARFDATVIEQLNAKLLETSEALMLKVDEQLELRVQRFEALTRTMMAFVGDPVDSLAEKLTTVLRAQEASKRAADDFAPAVRDKLQELIRTQTELIKAIEASRPR